MCALNSSSYVCLPAIAGMRAERRNAEAMEERERTWAEEREGAWAHRVGQAGPMALIPQKGHGKQASEEARLPSNSQRTFGLATCIVWRQGTRAGSQHDARPLATARHTPHKPLPHLLACTSHSHTCRHAHLARLCRLPPSTPLHVAMSTHTNAPGDTQTDRSGSGTGALVHDAGDERYRKTQRQRQAGKHT